MDDSNHQFEALYQTARRLPPDQQLSHLLRLYPVLVHHLTASSALHFYTLFAQVSYLASRYQVSRRWAYALHVLRRELYERQLPDEQLLPIADACIAYLLDLSRRPEGEAQGQEGFPVPPLPELPDPPGRARRSERRRPYARMVAFEWDQQARTLLATDEEHPAEVYTIHYGVADVNDIFAGTLELALAHIGLPLVLGLADLREDEGYHCTPGYIVLLPDLLMPVTGVANMLLTTREPSPANLPGMFVPSRHAISLLKGNVANLFLDELVRDPERSFAELMQQAFRTFPIPFSRLKNEEVRALLEELEQHHGSIRTVVTQQFEKESIDRTQCHIEPSYFSPRYGLKGRLDLFHAGQDNSASTIVELKSSQPFRPNHYNLNEDHYRQTLLYDLIIRSTNGHAQARRNYILYSGQPDNPLRFAAPAESLQKELIHGRNQWVLLQHYLMHPDRMYGPDLFAAIHPDRMPEVTGFLKHHVHHWAEVYDALPPADRSYFKAFAAFICREHTLAAIGHEAGEGSGGLAGLWLDAIRTKEERYVLLQGLHLERAVNADQQTLLHFRRGDHTHPLANFREGDIVVVYPFSDEPHPDPTRHQLLRATVLNIDQTSVVIRLRDTQVNTSRLASGTLWNAEPDMLDSGYGKLYESLWMLMACAPDRRSILLGRQPPGLHAGAMALQAPAILTRIQQAIFEEGIRARDLYLLWGPPGTGKTSILLREWVRYYATERTDKLLILAYTNRAVDEICEAISTIGTPATDGYIRIGSRSGTGDPFRHRLLDEVIAPLQTRAQILALLGGTRVVVATVSSMLGKMDLFELIGFDVAIVDEASQLLEPVITGLLTHVSKAILIGDHMQLPAVSQQSEAQSRISEGQAWAADIGLMDLRMSYFERLYRHYQRQGWHTQIGTLSEQGRMHAHIMEAANALIYDTGLTCLDPVRQSTPLRDFFPASSHWLTTERLAFVHVPTAQSEILAKTAIRETQVVATLLEAWSGWLARHQPDWRIGVITPFRAQIAAILQEAHIRGIDMSAVTVDTVERYQGGARDIIIMSAAVGHPTLLNRIVSLNAEGYDRKLNVALTRARQQFILVGDAQVLATAASYRKLIDMSYRTEGSDFGLSKLGT